MAQESVLRIVIDSRNAERNARNIANELQSIERNGNYATRSMDSMSVATRSLVGYMGGLVTIGAAINKMDVWTGLQNRLKLVTDSQAELTTAMNDTFAIAQKTASSWDSAAMVYQRFADNADRLGISMKQTAVLTETVSKAISISGGSAASAEAALMQFGQALASGVLRGEEFNSIAEQAPGLLKAIAFGLDTNVGSLRAMAADGKITGDVLVESLSKAQPYIDDLFNKTDFTISQSFTRLSNEVTKFVGEAGAGSGAASALSGSISTLAENLELIADGAFVVGIGYITKAIATKTVAVYSSIVATTASIEAEKVSAAQTLRSALAEKTAAEAELTRARDAVASAEMQVQADRKVIASEMQRIESSLAQVAAEKQLEIERLKNQINDQGRIATSTRMAELQQVQASMTAELTVLERQLGATTVASSAQFVAAREAQVVATGNLAATTEVATVAQAQNNAVQRAGLLTSTGLVGALGGPLGLGITVAALAATYLMFRDSSDDVNDSLSSQIEVVSELAQKYRELTLEKLINEMGELEKKQAQGVAQSSKAIAGIMGIVVATEYSTQAQKERANEWNKIAVDVRNGVMLTGAAIAEMTKKGFTKEEIQKASAFFAEFNDGKVKANEAAQSIAFVTQQTGLYGDKLDETGKKIAEKKLIVKGLEGDYRSLSTQIDTNIQWLLQQDGALNTSAEQQKNIANATDAWNNKTITASELAKVLKANLPIDSGLLVGFDNLATKTDKAKKELNTANHELKQVQANGPKAKQGFADAATGAKDAESEVGKLNEKLKDFNKTLADKKFDADFTSYALSTTKFTESQIKSLLEVTAELRKKGIALDSEAAKQMYAKAVEITRIEDKNQAIIDAKKDSEKEITKEKERQAKLGEKQYKYSSADLKMMQNVAKLSAEANLDGIGAKYGIPKNYLAGLMAQESGGNKNAVSPTGAIGYFQTTAAYRKDNGISVADSKNLPVIAEVVSKNLAKAFEKLGNWDAAIRSHNAGLAGSTQFEKTGKVDGNAARNKEVANFSPSVNKWIVGLGGSSLKTKGAANPLDDLKEYFAFLEDQAKSRKSLEFEVANEVTKIRENLKDKLIELDKAGFSPERTKELRDEFETRADNEIAIAKHALKTKLDDYGAFKKTESELLKDSFDEKKFYAAHDLELDAEGRKKAVALLDEQLKQEQGLLMLANETRLFQIREQFMTETAVMMERYRLEREQILLNSKLSEDQKQREIELSKAAQQEDSRRRVNNAVQNWGGIQADMNGTGDQYRLEQERFGRYDASQNVFDSQMAQTDQAAQDPNANMQEIAAQREAIWQAHHDRMTAIESDYYESSQSLQLAGMGQIASGLTSIIGDMAGEQSGAYKAMFAIEKGYAIAQSALAIQIGVSKAIALGFPQNIPVIAQTVMEGAKIASAIKSITTQGFETGGYTGSGGRKDVAGVVHGQEYVLNAAATKRVGVGTLDAINSGKGLGGGGAGDVTITQHITFTESGAKVDTQGQKEIAQSLNNMMDAWARRESRQGGVLYKLTKG